MSSTAINFPVDRSELDQSINTGNFAPGTALLDGDVFTSAGTSYNWRLDSGETYGRWRNEDPGATGDGRYVQLDDQGGSQVINGGGVLSINDSVFLNGTSGDATLSGSVVFEGATADAYETTLSVVDPTADRAVVIPDVSGNVVTTGDTGSVTSTMITDGTIVDADINASAAIGLSKLATGALPTGITVTSANISDLSIVDADVNASAAIAGTKISPDFGSQDVLTTGDLGVGTSSPDLKLEVSGGQSQTTDQFTNLVRVAANAPGDPAQAEMRLDFGIQASNTSTTNRQARIQAQTGDGTGRYLLLNPAGGRVGIGTTGPVRLLEIKSDGTAADEARFCINEKYNASSTGFGIDFKRTYDTGGDNQDAGYIRMLRNGGTTNLGLTFGVGDRNSVSERMRLDSSGRLLLGTSAFNSGLTGLAQVEVSDSQGGLIINSTSTSSTSFGRLFFLANGGITGTEGLIRYSNNDYHMAFYTAGGERMRINSSGTLSLGQNSTTNNLLSLGRSSTGGYIAFNINGANYGFIGSSDVLYSGGTNTDLGIRSENKLRFMTNGDTLQLTINASGIIYSVPTYNSSTSNAANVHIASNGSFARSTSSLKYKTNIETVEDSYADAILNCRPVWYRSTCDVDNPEHGWWGFIAEEVAEIDPRLVQWKTVEISNDDEKGEVETPIDPVPDGVAYDRFVPLLLNLIKRQQTAIETLETKVAQLETYHE